MFWRRRPSPDVDPSSIGSILHAKGKITQEQLAAAVEAQAKGKQQLGELLRAYGVSEADIEGALVEQKILRAQLVHPDEARKIIAHHQQAIANVKEAAAGLILDLDQVKK